MQCIVYIRYSMHESAPASLHGATSSTIDKQYNRLRLSRPSQSVPAATVTLNSILTRPIILS